MGNGPKFQQSQSNVYRDFSALKYTSVYRTMPSFGSNKKTASVSIFKNYWIAIFYYENVQMHRKVARIVRQNLYTS